MIAPAVQLANLTDYVGLQDDLTMMLLSYALLAKVNATQERKFLLDSTIAVDSLWMTPRNGGTGAGIIVEDIRPVARTESNALVVDLLCGFVVLCERNLCMTEGSVMLHPEQIEQIVVDLLDQKVLQPYGQLCVAGNFAEPATDWMPEDSGIYARRVRFKILNARRKTASCDLLTVSDSAGVVTCTCTSAADGLQIFYTTDKSFPANDAAINPQTNLYTGPFAAASGTVVRAMAFAPGLIPSALKQITVP